MIKKCSVKLKYTQFDLKSLMLIKPQKRVVRRKIL